MGVGIAAAAFTGAGVAHAEDADAGQSASASASASSASSGSASEKSEKSGASGASSTPGGTDDTKTDSDDNPPPSKATEAADSDEAPAEHRVDADADVDAPDAKAPDADAPNAETPDADAPDAEAPDVAPEATAQPAEPAADTTVTKTSVTKPAVNAGPVEVAEVKAIPAKSEVAERVSTAETVAEPATVTPARTSILDTKPVPVAVAVAPEGKTGPASQSSAVSTLAVAASAPAPSLLTWLQDLFLGWQRMFNNATPTVASQKVNISLAASTSVSNPIAFGGTDPDGDPLRYSVTAKGTATGPKYGTVTIDQATGTFTYNPDDALTGAAITDTFTVTVQDSGFHFHGLFGFLGLLGGHGATATITVNVGAVNNAPVAVADKVSGIANSTVTGNVLTNDSDADGDKLTATLISGPGHGAVDFRHDGSFTYTPTTGFTGTDTFTYTASDGVKTSAVADVTITVAAIVDTFTPTIGVQGLSWWLGLSDADTNKALDMSKAAGVASVRIDISWYVVEYNKGGYDWSSTDPLVDKIVAHQMTVLGMVYDTPAWLSGSTDPHAPPADPQKFAQFAAAAATHYTGKINTWEIWNEQNIPRFWVNPDPAAYANLLKAVYPAIKAVNPNAVVITGGLSPDGSGIDPVTYITAMYAAGAGGYFDAIALHPYTFPALPTMASVLAVHTVMAANGDGNKKIWLTEVGAPTGTSDVAVSEAAQAASIARFVKFARTTSYLGPIYLYSLLDTGTDPAQPEDNFGLLKRDFTPKQAWGVWLLNQEDLDTLVASAVST